MAIQRLYFISIILNMYIIKKINFNNIYTFLLKLAFILSIGIHPRRKQIFSSNIFLVSDSSHQQSFFQGSLAKKPWTLFRTL